MFFSFVLKSHNFHLNFGEYIIYGCIGACTDISGLTLVYMKSGPFTGFPL